MEPAISVNVQSMNPMIVNMYARLSRRTAFGKVRRKPGPVFAAPSATRRSRRDCMSWITEKRESEGEERRGERGDEHVDDEATRS